MKVGDRILVLQRPDLATRGGTPVKRAGQTGTVHKLNGSEVLINFDTGELAWVRRKWLSVQDQQPQPA